MLCSIQTDIELPHFGRLPIRVLVCDPLGCCAQRSHAEHSVNLGIFNLTLQQYYAAMRIKTQHSCVLEGKVFVSLRFQD